MQKRQTTDTLEPFWDPENPREVISSFGLLSASIVHDLRNPLGTICAGAELLMDLDSTSTQVKRLAANLCRAAGRMREMLEELTSVARDNASRPQICDLRQVIAAASEAVLAAMARESIRTLLDVPTGIAVALVRSQIERVFFNLIANATEAVPRGGEVHIRARKIGVCVHVELEDTGPGIPDGIRDRLFEPFFTSGKHNGLGLGLALARQTVRNHGGDIWTEPAAGARFVIRLPLREARSGPGSAASSENMVKPHHGSANVANDGA